MKNCFLSFAAAAPLCLSIVLTGCSGSPATPPPSTSPAAPTIASIMPTKLGAGALATSLTINGTGYTTSTSVQVGGVIEASQFVSSTQMTATIPATQLATGALLSVIVLNGTSTSGSGTLTNLEIDNPPPAVSQFVPSNFATGSVATSIAVTGTGFVPGTVIEVAGSPRATTFSSSTLINAILTAADLATPGSISFDAKNPSPGGGASAAASFAVNNPSPANIALAPSSVVIGTSKPSLVTVSGSGFLPTSIVQVNGLSYATAYISPTQLSFQLSVSDQSTAAFFLVSVINPAPGGGISPAATLTVAPPTGTPFITSVQPTSLIVGSSDTSISVFGYGFTLDSVVDWNGSALVTSYFSQNGYGSSLSAIVPASLLTAAGSANITVNSPTSTPTLSNALAIAVANPPAPTLFALLPAGGPTNIDTPVIVSGTGFTAQSTVSVNGTNLPATFTSASSLSVTLSAASIALPGNLSFTVTTPAPGGGTTTPLIFTAYIGIVNNSMIFNPSNGLFYVSVPSSAGKPYGNSIVSVDPATGALGTPILVGSEPNKLAITSDGKFLWVGLDGASAVRKVDLTANTAGLQFGLGGNSGIYAGPPTALALAALPGATDSVVVSSNGQYNSPALAIYDNGVLRGPAPTTYNFGSQGLALLVNGTKQEVYAGASNSYNTYTYTSAGLTANPPSTSSTAYATSANDEMQITGGKLYTDFGTVYDPESGSLLGTFYSSGTNTASGTTVADTTLGKVFILDNITPFSYNIFNQIQIFNLSDYTASTLAVIPVSIVFPSSLNGNPFFNSSPTRLTRWGTNGLAFRTGAGVYSLRSNSVKDLSGVSTDLGVTLAASGANTTGSNTTYTATITNSGPAAATNVALSTSLPASGVLISLTPSAGTCTTTGAITCDLGSLASGATASVTLVLQQTVAGASTLTVQVSGSENDPVLSNNQASSTQTITGAAYNVPPVISSLNPAAVLAGSNDTVITIQGSGFSSNTSILFGGTALATGYSSSTTLTATVPAAQLSTLGWGAITASSPAPGGGVSAPLPLSIYSVVTLGVNHILYEPFSRKIYASVGSGSASVTGNTIAAITPETGVIGTPVNIGSQPTKMALSDDGNILYALLGGANSVARFNLNTQQTEFSFSPAYTNYGTPTSGFRDLAVQPGTENTLAIDFGYTSGLGLFDIDPVAKTGTLRGTILSFYIGTSLHFYDAKTLYLFNTDTWQTLDQYGVDAKGLSFDSAHARSNLFKFGTFQLAGKLAFADNGGVADLSTLPASQVGVYQQQLGYGALQKVAPDTSLGRVFFLTNTSSNANYFSVPDSILTYNQASFLPTDLLPINFAVTEGNTSFSAVDLIRWGQDGLAALTSGGHIYLLRGPAVVPQLLNSNTAATLTSSSTSAFTHGAGNAILTLTGSNFIPGVAALWNGSYRTTTIVDPTHLTVAIPAADLLTAGSASLTAINPGAASSGTVTITIN